MKPLSFIIITYNRPADTLELLKNISQLDRTTDLLQEVIVMNNASTSDYSEVKEYINNTPSIPFRYFYAPENMGVSRGRNYAMQQATAPILIALDDDAVLQNKDCLGNLVKEFEAPAAERSLGIVAFKVFYYDTKQMQVNAFPHKRFHEYKDKPYFQTYYYAGCGHAIKREVIEKTGAYPNDFFYGMEEYDLSYRVLDAGYSIAYSDKIVMLHKESPLGRKPKNEKIREMWVNKCKVAYRYLPKRYYYSTGLMWSLQYLKLTGLDFSGFFKGWRQFFSIPKTQQRTPVRKTTMAYLRKVKARLWY